MSAQGSGAAALNGTKGFELLKVEARSIPLQEAIALHVEDVGHLEGGPSHVVLFTVVLTVNFLYARERQTFQGIGDGP